MADDNTSNEQFQKLLEELSPQAQKLVLQRAAMRELGPFLSLVDRVEYPSTRFLILKMCRISLSFACSNHFPHDEQLKRAVGAACDMKPTKPFEDDGIGSDWWAQEVIRRAIGGVIAEGNEDRVGPIVYAFDELLSHGSIANERQLGLADMRVGNELSNVIPLYSKKPGIWSPYPTHNRVDEAPIGTPGFQFWVDWYWSFLRGEPLDWELQRAVALIDHEVWEAGPERVAERIREIEADFTYRAAKINETLVLDETSLVFSAKPVASSNAGRLARHLSRVSDALDDIIALGGNNGLTENTSEYRMIRRLVEKYEDDPERIAFDLTDVNGIIRRQIKSGEYPDNEPIRILQAANTACISTICDMEPDVAAELDRVYPREPEVLEEEGQNVIEAALDFSADTLDQAARETTQEDAAEILYGAIVDAAKDGLPEGPRRVADTYRKIVLRRQISRLSQIAREWAQGSKLAEHYDSKPSKAAGVIMRYGGVLSLLYAAIIWLGRMLGVS